VEGELQITKAVVVAAAGNAGSKGEVIKPLLNRRGDEVKITEGGA
jgi:hypothetical protein